MPQRPNIVIFLTDDLGFSDVGCYGGEIQTPNLDALAQNGLRFTDFYTSPKCFPSRACLLTGQYAQKVGLGRKPCTFQNCVTLGEALRPTGYRTLMTGKWHAQEIPYARGFDRHFGLTDGSCNYFNPGLELKFNRPRRWAIDDQELIPYVPDDPDFYTTDAFADHAIDYLETYKGEDQPFLLYVAFNAPHYPLHARPEDVAKYKGKYMVGWDEVRAQRHARQKEMEVFDDSQCLPDRGQTYQKLWRQTSRWMTRYWDDDDMILPWEDVENKEDWDLKMAIYAAMVDRVDQNIGRVMDKIEELGETDNTLVMFLSDNGACPGTHHLTPDAEPGTADSYDTVDMPWANASNTPFRKYKDWCHEGGIATPFIVSWPAVIQNGGTLMRQPGHAIDIMATCLEVAGAEYPTEHNGQPVFSLDGKSLLPIFEGQTREGHDALYWQWHQCKAVRKGNWKLVSEFDASWELYDLQMDRTEINNLGELHPGKVRELSALWADWFERCCQGDHL